LKQELISVPISENIDSDHVDNSTSKNMHLSKHSKIKNSAEEQLDVEISKYLLKHPMDNWIKEFQKKLLLITIANGWSFRWIECNEVLDLLYHLNSALQLKPSAIPSRLILGGMLFNNAANELQDKTLKNLKDAKSIILTFDGWKNIVKKNILGITCVTENGDKYYEMWTGNEPKDLASEMTNYQNKIFPFDDNQVCKQSNNLNINSNKVIQVEEKIVNELDYTQAIDEWFVQLDNEAFDKMYQEEEIDSFYDTTTLHPADDPKVK
ncbi:2766_t:CDS:2, partial [Racocetra fulgida]